MISLTATSSGGDIAESRFADHMSRIRASFADLAWRLSCQPTNVLGTCIASTLSSVLHSTTPLQPADVPLRSVCFVPSGLPMHIFRLKQHFPQLPSLSLLGLVIHIASSLFKLKYNSLLRSTPSRYDLNLS